MPEPEIPARTLALFGATGRTGRLVLSEALERGWTVRALARRPEALPPHPRLTVIPGEIADDRAVADAVAGSNAVLSVIGHVAGSPPDLMTAGLGRVVAAMRTSGVDRIVSLTGGGVRFPERDRPRLPDRVIRGLLVLLQRAVLRDAENHVQVLRDSGLDWTVVRAPMLTDAPPTGHYRVGWVGVDASTRIGRADLATALLDELDSDRHRRELPFVSW